jgi:hypothetical protein
MKKIISGIAIGLAAISGIALAQSMTTKTDSINVNFVSKTASISSEFGYYDNSGSWVAQGATSQATVSEPAFDIILNQLAQANALNLETVQSVIRNNI